MAEARSYQDSSAYRNSWRKDKDGAQVWPLTFPSTSVREVRHG